MYFKQVKKGVTKEYQAPQLQVTEIKVEQNHYMRAEDGDENAYGFAPISFEEGCSVVDSDKDGNADKVTMIINCGNSWKIFTKVYTK